MPRTPNMRARRGGWYCSGCGTCHDTLPAGFVTCRRCGHLGLRGYCNYGPVGLACGFPGCEWQGWDDGGVNDDAGRHLRLAHPEAWVQARQVPRKGWAVFVLSGEKVWPPDEHAWRQRIRAWDKAAKMNTETVLRGYRQ
jgi:hypothetical protein